MRHRVLTAGLVLSVVGLGCDPVSTKDLGAQRQAIEAEGQMAMQEQTGTVGNPAFSELEPNVNVVSDPFDPDPFIQARRQELASREVEGTEVPIAEPQGIGTDPTQADPDGDIGQP